MQHQYNIGDKVVITGNADDLGAGYHAFPIGTICTITALSVLGYNDAYDLEGEKTTGRVGVQTVYDCDFTPAESSDLGIEGEAGTIYSMTETSF